MVELVSERRTYVRLFFFFCDAVSATAGLKHLFNDLSPVWVIRGRCKKMTNKDKKLIKAQQIKLGKVNKKQRAALWQYILSNDLGMGYLQAQELERKGFKILKEIYREGQPD